MGTLMETGMMVRRFLLSAAILSILINGAKAAETEISPEARALLKQMTAAYSELHSLQVAGTFSADLDIAGQQRSEKTEFSGFFQAPNRFRHELKDDTTLGSTGEKVFAYSKKPNLYLTAAAPAERPAAGDLPDTVQQLLDDQNPSLLMAVVKDPESAIKANIVTVSTQPPTNLEGKSYDTLVLSEGTDKPVTRLLVDPKTHLIRQAITDMKADAIRRGAVDVKKALVTIDYATTTPNATLADGIFAWSAPAGAREASASAGDDGEPGSAAKELTGKPAPDFTLQQVAGGKIHLKDTLGSVVVLDIWATWCPPCVEGLPHIDALAKEYKDKGVKAFAINAQEDEETVKKFIEAKKLTLPVLLDPTGDVNTRYKAEAIPETIVIGKDGVIRNVFVGLAEDEVHKAVDDAVKAR